MLVIERYTGGSASQQRVELVERTSTGHPDLIRGSIMEAVSVALSREYPVI